MISFAGTITILTRYWTLYNLHPNQDYSYKYILKYPFSWFVTNNLLPDREIINSTWLQLQSVDVARDVVKIQFPMHARCYRTG